MSIDGFQRSADPGQHDSVDAPPADRGEVPRSVSIQASTETDPEIGLLEQTLRRPGRRIGQRGDATRAPTQGPRPERAARCRPTAYRDWPKSDKSIHSSCSQSLA